MVRDLIMLGIGAAIGGTVSYLYLKGQFNEAVEKEAKASRDFARMKIAEFHQRAEIAEMALEKMEAVVFEEPDEEVEDEEMDTDVNPYEESMEEYGRFTGPSDDRRDIHFITRDEFNEPEPPYRKETLLHYHFDKILATDNEELIDDPVSLVGDCIDHMEADGPWQDCYIRNNSLSIDYNVVNILGSFPSE